MLVAPGDTWAALAIRFGTTVDAFQESNPHPNRQRQPVIGQLAALPETAVRPERSGRLVRPTAGGLLAEGLKAGVSPWRLAALNGLDTPAEPVLGRLLLVPGDSVPREYPPGMGGLTLSHLPARAGEGMAFWGTIEPDMPPATVRLGTAVGSFHRNLEAGRGVGLLGTGAFFLPGAPELEIRVENRPLWSQPWPFENKEWTFNQITLTGSAAAISQEEIQAERERLFALWEQVSPTPGWQTPFEEPVKNYLEYSSFYGARRSYNGGPYRTYHEGLDFAAYGGTPVFAPAAGTVVLAEILYVRGGAVIIDHGLGIYSGAYHMSAVLVEAGSVVEPGTMIGEVGTTGLSTGNHLHWDLLVNGIWVDPLAWREQGMSCWILDGWGTPCRQIADS